MKKENIKKSVSGRKRISGRVLSILIVAALFTAILAGGLLARYRSDNQRQAELVASQFHFSSDYLDEESENKRYEITDWKDGFDIRLYNYEKKNTALISTEDIAYTVSLTDSNGNSGKWTYTDENNGKMTSSEEKRSQIITVKPQNGVSAGDTVTVTVKTTAPFKRTLKAEFVMKGKDQPDYTITDESDNISVLLTVKSNGYSGNITIQWPSDVYAPDNTNPLMESWKNTTEVNTSQQLAVEKNTTYKLLFFRKKATVNATGSGSGTAITLE